MTAQHVYLDWNATTPPHPEVLAAVDRARADGWANPASVHGPGRRARAFVEAAREAVAALTGFDPRDVVLTSGGTEANNLALAHAFGDGKGALVVSSIEHPSVARAADALAARGVVVAQALVSPSGVVSAEAILEAVANASRTAEVRLVSLQAVNHETGVIQPVREVAAALLGRGIALHVDAVQAVGRLPPSAWAGADLVTVAAHKIRGPKGIGALATRAGLALRPVLVGGAQERGLRPGTQDAVACAGFAAAASRALSTASAYTALEAVRDRLEAALIEVAAPLGGAVRNGEALRAPHVANLSFARWRGEELAAALDLEGVAVSSGAACSAGTAEPSPVVLAMLGAARATSALRISLGEATTSEDVALALAAFRSVLVRA